MPSLAPNSSEGLEFISSADSPAAKPLLVIAYEMTGTAAVYEISH